MQDLVRDKSLVKMSLMDDLINKQTNTQPRGMYLNHHSGRGIQICRATLNHLDPIPDEDPFALPKKGLENTHCGLQDKLHNPPANMPRLGWGTGKDDDRGRSAPMQGVEYERPMDPGPFQVPNKREL